MCEKLLARPVERCSWSGEKEGNEAFASWPASCRLDRRGESPFPGAVWRDKESGAASLCVSGTHQGTFLKPYARFWSHWVPLGMTHCTWKQTHYSSSFRPVLRQICSLLSTPHSLLKLVAPCWCEWNQNPAYKLQTQVFCQKTFLSLALMDIQTSIHLRQN